MTKNGSRVGVIIKCPLNGQFHDVVIDVLTSHTDVFEVDDGNDTDEPTLGTQKNGIIPIIISKGMA